MSAGSTATCECVSANRLIIGCDGGASAGMINYRRAQQVGADAAGAECGVWFPAGLSHTHINAKTS